MLRTHVLLIVLLTSALPSAAQQFTLVDDVFTFAEDGHVGDIPPKEATESWKKPVDYYGGWAHIRVEVMQTANTSTPVSVLCRVLSGEHKDRAKVSRLGYRKVVFRKPGVYHFRIAIASMEPLVSPSDFRWDVRPTALQIVAADKNGQMVSRWEHDLGTFLGQMQDYLPLKVRYTAIIVAKGGRFQAPVGW